MGTPRIDTAIGVVDGVNDLFSTPVPYVVKSLSVFLNGQLKRRDLDDGWVEISAVHGTFRLKEVPRVGEVVQAFYQDGSPGQAPDQVELLHIRGMLTSTQDLRGIWTLREEAVGLVVASASLGGRVTAQIQIRATLTESGALHGTLREC